MDAQVMQKMKIAFHFSHVNFFFLDHAVTLDLLQKQKSRWCMKLNTPQYQNCPKIYLCLIKENTRTYSCRQFPYACDSGSPICG